MRGYLLVAILLLGTSLLAQVPSPQPSPSASPVPAVDPLAPKPYGDKEFPDWLKAIRRFEVITIGSFPISFLYVNLAYDVGRYVSKSSNGDADAATYAPFLFAPPNKPAYTQEETTGLILASLGVAVGVALGDLVIGLVEQATAEAKAKKDKEAQDAARLEAALRPVDPGPTTETAPAPSPDPEASPSPNPDEVPQ